MNRTWLVLALGLALLAQTAYSAGSRGIENSVHDFSAEDVHNLVGSAPVSRILLKINGSDTTGRRDLLCRNCHIK